jgi:hypothetical protein
MARARARALAPTRTLPPVDKTAEDTADDTGGAHDGTHRDTSGDTYCDHCGAPLGSGGHEGCDAARRIEPPRYCAKCRRRLVVQVTPRGWSARCSRHGPVDPGA